MNIKSTAVCLLLLFGLVGSKDQKAVNPALQSFMDRMARGYEENIVESFL